MKTINVTELKTHLSRYLRAASRGARIVVKDRNEPIAQLGPLDKQPVPGRERLAREGRLQLGTQAWADLRISPLDRRRAGCLAGRPRDRIGIRVDHDGPRLHPLPRPADAAPARLSGDIPTTRVGGLNSPISLRSVQLLRLRPQSISCNLVGGKPV